MPGNRLSSGSRVVLVGMSHEEAGEVPIRCKEETMAGEAAYCEPFCSESRGKRLRDKTDESPFA